MSNIYSVVASFMEEMVLARLVPTCGCLLCHSRCIGRSGRQHAVEVGADRHVPAGGFDDVDLMSSFNSGGELALADVLDSLWNYLAGRIMPIAAGLAIIGAILNFAAARPWLRLVACSMAFLTVSALWRLVVAMM